MFLHLYVTCAFPAPSGFHTPPIFNFVGSHWQQVQTGLDGKMLFFVPQESTVPDPEAGLRHLTEALGKSCSARLFHFFSQNCTLSVHNSLRRSLQKLPDISQFPRETPISVESSPVPPWSRTPVSLAKSLT